MVSGVPQGTVLGHLLFLLHINDLPSVVSSKVRLFADDCLIYRNIKNKEDQIALQKDLNLLENWGNTWGMRFNQKYNSDKIERVQRQAARFVKSRYSRYSSVSDMLDVLGWTPLSQRRQEARLILFTNLLTVRHKCPSKASLSRRIRVLEENTT